jgi:UDP-2,3-diacylglucosamine hydrolase
MSALFISDLHLHAGDARSIEGFTEFVARDARAASELFILGDLFEAWIGDDDDDPRIRPVVEALAQLTRSGVPCAIMHGNRDFLIGPRFAAETGCRLLGDFELVELYGERVLLTHGDLLCTDDTRYLKLRAELRDPAWQREFLHKSLAERRQIASDLRQLSATEIAMKPADIMDVNQAAVERAMREHDVALMLHGHTHRPAVHRFPLGERTATRIVLGAWYERPSVVRWGAAGFRLEELDWPVSPEALPSRAP